MVPLTKLKIQVRSHLLVLIVAEEVEEEVLEAKVVNFRD
jgi:hypothetical protein